jgi:hypothetical protein
VTADSRQAALQATVDIGEGVPDVAVFAHRLDVIVMKPSGNRRMVRWDVPRKSRLPLSRHAIARPLTDVLMRYPSVVIVDDVNGSVRGVRWEVEGDAKDWERIQSSGWFGVRPDILGPIYGGGFVPDRPYIFTLQLLPYIFTPLGLLASGPEDLVNLLRGLAPDAAVRQPDSWRLLSVMQQQNPKVQIGLTTSYFDQQLA